MDTEESISVSTLILHVKSSRVRDIMLFIRNNKLEDVCLIDLLLLLETAV